MIKLFKFEGCKYKGIYPFQKNLFSKNIAVSNSLTNILPARFFQNALRNWYQKHRRPLPWREVSDPYKIWLSEIILQQTRVAQGTSYYHKFIEHYPTVHHLAQATEDEILKDWEGLGYYSRARNLHAAAKQISEEFGGQFPSDYESILKLKGVGPYTAAAIASFAFGLPRAVVDGNVLRVLSRFLGENIPVNSPKGQKIFQNHADKLLDSAHPAAHNQAIMEFGALQCVPKNPDCAVCPLREKCVAFSVGKVAELPVKIKKNYDRHRFFHFYILKNKRGQALVEQRTGNDIWKGLFQFPAVESEMFFSESEFLENLQTEIPNHAIILESVAELKPHKLSHQTIHSQIFEINGNFEDDWDLKENQRWVSDAELDALAFPKPLRAFLDGNQLVLPLG